MDKNSKIKVDDLCRVKQSKCFETGALVRVVDEFGSGIFLCTNNEAFYIVVADNLELVEYSAAQAAETGKEQSDEQN